MDESVVAMVVLNVLIVLDLVRQRRFAGEDMLPLQREALQRQAQHQQKTEQVAHGSEILERRRL